VSRMASGPLGVRNFRLLAGGQFASTIGDYCYAVALPWLVLSSHGGAILLGTVLACYGVPRTVLIPVGGVLADKVGARTVMLVADAVRCVLVAALAVLAARHTASLTGLRSDEGATREGGALKGVQRRVGQQSAGPGTRGTGGGLGPCYVRPKRKSRCGVRRERTVRRDRSRGPRFKAALGSRK
jgi:Major Facilitator Superfamily